MAGDHRGRHVEYIEAGSIIAIATSLAFWQAELSISDFAVGLLAALSANAFGAAIGAILGGPLCDRFGRKAIYTYDLLVYMAGVLVAAFAVNFTMLLIVFVVTGIAAPTTSPTRRRRRTRPTRCGCSPLNSASTASR